MAAVMSAQTPGPPPGARPPGAPASTEDPNDAASHGVARLSWLQGNVSVVHGDSATDSTPAALNAPLVAADRILTGDSSRAEVQFDATNMVRLSSSTEVRLSELEYKRYQVQIAAGTVMFHTVRDNDAQAEISTPTVLVRPVRRGSIRVSVGLDGMTQITVRSGQAEVFGPTGSEYLNPGQTMLARGPASDPEVQTVVAIAQDDWDRWNADRDQVFDRVGSVQNVSPDVYGTESLDPYGQWRNDPQYGEVWVPSVDAGWAPYSEGRWVWVDYYGWTWLGAEPWAWAPYHYGWWYRPVWGGWAWYPGPIAAHYYWRPALVGFFGWGGGFGVSFGFGFANVGWCPLAPFEVFHPWYGRGFGGGYNRFTVVNNVNITNVYHNASYPNAVTSVRASDFGQGSINASNLVRASAGDLSRAGLVQGPMPLRATPSSGRFSDAAVATRGMPQTNSNLRFSTAGSAAGSRFAGAVGTTAARGFTPAPQAAARGGPAAPSNSGGWQRVNPSGANRGALASPGGGGAGAGGWRGFATPNNPGGAQNRGFSQPPPSRGFSNRGFSNAEPPGGRFASPPRSADPGPRGGGNLPQERGGFTPQERGGFNAQPRGGFGGPQERGFSAPQRVQINPPIVRERGAGSSGYSHPQSHAGGFGSAHSFGGGAPRGGGNRGGGSHGGGRR